MSVNTSDLLNQLASGSVEIDFVKVTTGEKRKMRATLNSSLLKESVRSVFNSGNKPQASDSERVTVWDLDANSWRSIYVNTITSVKAA